MGGPKALMMVRGRVWWEIQEERLAGAGLARVWVVSREVREGMKGCGSRMVHGDADAPMFASVRAGVEAVRGESEFAGVMVLPVDVPAPGRAVVDALLRNAGRGPAVPVCCGKRGHPVALPRQWIERVLVPACGRGPEPRLDEMIAAELVEVGVEDQDVVVNLNTSEDVARWESSHR
jgi:CTP:molybdopterin cytidylyltransferase MocA